MATRTSKEVILVGQASRFWILSGAKDGAAAGPHGFRVCMGHLFTTSSCGNVASFLPCEHQGLVRQIHRFAPLTLCVDTGPEGALCAGNGVQSDDKARDRH